MDTYHPKRERNEILDPEEKIELLRNGNHVTIAMCNSDIPYIVTLSYGYDMEGNALYFHCANTGEKLDFIKTNPNVCATLIKDNGYLEGSCDHDYESLIIRGKIRIVGDLAEKKKGLMVLMNHLENTPKPIFERNIKSDHSYESVTILKLEMDSIIGKKYTG